ncbi:MAG: hypothetical protein Q4P08_06640 [Eubacteriales bacterium]|nr:hypothetical protein [Eubacteriales bacterium]
MKMAKIIALALTLLGFFGNLIIYILSRAIEVMLPFIFYKGGEKWYRWDPDFTGRSYKYFIQEYNLELLTIFFWTLVILGVIALLIPKKRLLSICNKLGISGKKPKRIK